jgi:hypothetical protein
MAIKVSPLKKIGERLHNIVQISRQIDEHQEKQIKELNECDELCNQAAEQCMKLLIQDLKEFVSDTSTQTDHKSYEDWIRHCHPENTRDGIFIDHRFYAEKSDHRIAWNRLMKKRGKDYLIVKAQRPGHVRSNTF